MAVSPLVSPLASLLTLQPHQCSVLPPRLQCLEGLWEQLPAITSGCGGVLGSVSVHMCLRQNKGARRYFAKPLKNSH